MKDLCEIENNRIYQFDVWLFCKNIWKNLLGGSKKKSHVQHYRNSIYQYIIVSGDAAPLVMEINSFFFMSKINIVWPEMSHPMSVSLLSEYSGFKKKRMATT